MVAGKSLGILILLASGVHGASGGVISGTVRDPGGAPSKGAFVQARSEPKSTITISVLSDKQGRYRIDNLSPGQYRIWATAIGYTSEPRSGMKVAAGESTSLDFALQKGIVRWRDLSVYQEGKLLPEGKGKASFVSRCNGCHGFQRRMAATRRDEEAWLRAVNGHKEIFQYTAMWQMPDQTFTDIASYANTVFGLDSKLPRSPAELPEYQKVKRGEFSDEAMKIVYVDYEFPGPDRFPFGAFPDQEGIIWIPCQWTANRIGRLDPNTGQVQEFRVPHQGIANILAVVPAPDGTAWLAERGPNKIGKWDPRTQTITEYQAAFVPGKERNAESGNKHTIRIDAKGYVWASGIPLSRFDPKTEKFTYFWELPDVYSVTLDREDSLWFSAYQGMIGKVDAKTGKLTTYATPSKGLLRQIQVDSEGIVWFAEFAAGKIGRFDPKTESFKEYSLPGGDPSPWAIGIDRNNQIWYSSYAMDVLGRLDPKTGQVTEYPFPYSEMNSKELLLDSKGRMWWGSPGNNKVGYFTLATGSGSQ